MVERMPSCSDIGETRKHAKIRAAFLFRMSATSSCWPSSATVLIAEGNLAAKSGQDLALPKMGRYPELHGVARVYLFWGKLQDVAKS